MYAVVGCTDCSALWIIETGADTAECPRCSRRHQTDRLKYFVETDSETHARDVRSSMLAERQGEGDAFATLEDYGTLDDRAEEHIVSDEEYLSAAGLDPDVIAAAGEEATKSTGSRSRREIITAAIRELDHPTESEVVAYASERGISESVTQSILTKLVRDGEALEREETYRLL